MAWFGSGGASVAELIAKKKYGKAIEALSEQLVHESGNPRVRLQLADVMVMAEKPQEAVPILIDVADLFASQGEGAKAIAALKKIERIAPGRRDVETKLASLIRSKSGPRAASGWQPREGQSAIGYEPAGASFSADHFERQPDPVVTDEARIAAAKAASWTAPTRAEAEAPEPIPIIEITPDPAPKDAAVEMSEAAFQAQMLDVIQHALKRPSPPFSVPASPAAAAEPAAGGFAGSPLFSSFSQEELVAVMRGLRLLSFEPGDIIITEGDSGDSLFVITTGIAKAFVRRDGKQVLARAMGDGTFFGEISILSGKPRTATVTAATACELLELDKGTLDEIKRSHPNVQKVLEDFYIQRASGA